MQLIDSLKTLHEKGYIHQALNMKNIRIKSPDLTELNSSRLILTNFASSKLWKSSEGHTKFEKCLPFCGDIAFASHHAHSGFSLGRRDDLISLVYLLVYMLRG